jgi:ABC-type Fe3+-hydroxamate transport system substrate-binding protein
MLHTSIQSIDSVKKKIVSLVPSITELLYDFGLNEEVVGITKFCVHPAKWLQEKTIVGGTKNLRISTIERLQPDLIIASKEENVEEQIKLLSQNFDVLLTDVISIEDGLQLLFDIGFITGKVDVSNKIIANTKSAFAELKQKTEAKNKIPKVVYLIWRDPLMSIGADTFIHHNIEAAGFENMLATSTRYPIISESELKNLAPDFIFLSSEPYPFNSTHQAELEKQFTDSKIVLVDGEMFSWYGSRMQKFPKYIIENLQLELL